MESNELLTQSKELRGDIVPPGVSVINHYETFETAFSCVSPTSQVIVST